jgi:CBS domain-containing protein
MQYFKPISYTENPITATGKEVVKSIAETMVKYKIGSVVIEKITCRDYY